MEVPSGLSSRPLRMSDAAAVAAVMTAQELLDVGEVSIEEADIIGDWQRPSYDVGAGSIGVFDGETLVAYGEHLGADRCDAAVHPDHRGRGIGTALAHWLQETARGRGSRTIGMPVPQGSPAEHLLTGLGYHPRWTGWELELPEGREVASRPLPAGYAVREARTEERSAVYRIVEDAFGEWAERDRETEADFAARCWRRPGFAPWMLRVVTDPTGEIVGAAVVLLVDADDTPQGYVDRLAVRADQRGRGLAQALLADAFTEARAHGAVRSGLTTDSRTGALGLYEKVGMEVTSAWVNLAIDV